MQGMTTERMAARKAKLAAWLRQGLIRLGPTFIKIGQQFSTRVDVLAPEFVKVHPDLVWGPAVPFRKVCALQPPPRELS